MNIIISCSRRQHKVISWHSFDTQWAETPSCSCKVYTLWRVSAQEKQFLCGQSQLKHNYQSVDQSSQKRANTETTNVKWKSVNDLSRACVSPENESTGTSVTADNQTFILTLKLFLEPRPNTGAEQSLNLWCVHSGKVTKGSLNSH